MGSYLNNYSGPVLIVKYTTKDVVDPYRACPNENCNRHRSPQKNSKFCPRCGTEIVEFEDATETVISPSNEEVSDAIDAAGLSDGALMPSNQMGEWLKAPKGSLIYFSNLRMDGRQYDAGSPENIILDIGDVDIEGEKKHFRDFYAPYIRVIANLYESYEIRWVFVNYYS